MYLPYIFRTFQGFKTKDVKEFHSRRHMQIILQPREDSESLCRRCGDKLGRKRGEHWVEAKHLKCFGWTSSVKFPVAKRECKTCKCIRSEWVPFICPTSPHITIELAWWMTRLTGITSVNQVSKLESVDKMTCYLSLIHISEPTRPY